MKKLLTLTLALIIALSMAACSPTPKERNVQSIGGGASSDANSTNSEGNKALSTSSQMGKVTSVVGNEIEINLVKEPEMPKADSAEGSLKLEGELSAAITMTPAIVGGKPVGGGAKERDDIELTGEIKTVIIPAGMPIKDAMGNEKQLTDIKKGSLLNVMVDSEGNITEVFLYE